MALANFLILVCGLLMRPSHCSSSATNVTAAAVGARRRFECYPYRPPSPALDMTAPVMDCARALLQFPKNAPPGKSVWFSSLGGGKTSAPKGINDHNVSS